MYLLWYDMIWYDTVWYDMIEYSIVNFTNTKSFFLAEPLCNKKSVKSPKKLAKAYVKKTNKLKEKQNSSLTIYRNK